MADYAVLADLGTLGAAADVIVPIADATKLAAITARSRFADGFLARYSPPNDGFVTFGSDLTWAVVQLVVYDLVSDLYRYHTDKPNESTVVKRHDEAMAWFQGVSRGDIDPALGQARVSAAFEAPSTRSSKPRGWTHRGDDR